MRGDCEWPPLAPHPSKEVKRQRGCLLQSRAPCGQGTELSAGAAHRTLNIECPGREFMKPLSRDTEAGAVLLSTHRPVTAPSQPPREGQQGQPCAIAHTGPPGGRAGALTEVSSGGHGSKTQRKQPAFFRSHKTFALFDPVTLLHEREPKKPVHW